MALAEEANVVMSLLFCNAVEQNRSTQLYIFNVHHSEPGHQLVVLHPHMMTNHLRKEHTIPNLMCYSSEVMKTDKCARKMFHSGFTN